MPSGPKHFETEQRTTHFNIPFTKFPQHDFMRPQV